MSFFSTAFSTALFRKIACGILLFVAITFSSSANAEEKATDQQTSAKSQHQPQYKTEIFADDFSRDQLGKNWKAYKSASQIKEGVLHGVMPKDSDHNAVDSIITKPYGDVEVALDFKFDGSPLFVVAFNEHKFKGSHAGHICRVIVKQNQIILRDGKTGVFQNDIFAKRKTRKNDAQIKALLKTKDLKIKTKLKKGTLYHLFIRIKGDKMTVFIDGKSLGTLKSDGIAHATKNKLSLVSKDQSMNFDNLKITAP